MDAVGGALQRVDLLYAERDQHQGLWDTIARYVIPSRHVFKESAEGSAQRERMVLDSTAPQSLILFASFLHTTLNNPSDRWFYVEPVDRDLLGVDPAVLRWAEDTETGIATAFATGETTVYETLHEAGFDLGAFGWSCFFTGVRNGRFWTKHIGIRDAAIADGPEGHVDTVAVTERLSLLQARKRWPGKSLGERLDRIPPERAASERLECVHLVFPASDEELVSYLPPEVREVDKPFYAMWLCRDTQHVIAADWYDHLPYICPRWARVAGSPYGRSPAMTALGDILMLNRMNETVLRGAEKLVDPPLLLPEGATLSPVRLFPGGLTYTDGEVKANPLVPPGASRIELGYELIQQRQEAVRNAFFVPLFINPDQPVKTARLALDTPVPLADGGWTTMGDVKVGDVLVGSDGRPTTVTHVHPIVDAERAYELEFYSGDRIVADHEHRWSVRRLSSKVWYTRTTQEIVDDFWSGEHRQAAWGVPLVPKVDRPAVELPIDPYVLGLWLGDGAARDAVITTMDGEIADAVQAWAEAEGFNVVLRSKGDKDNRAVDVSVRGPAKRWGDSMTDRLERLGVRNNKHIPELYLRGSHGQRLALLQGLMDSDGTVNGGGRATWYQAKGRLADDFVRLVEGLGLHPRVFEQPERKATWQAVVMVSFTSPWPVFRLPRKLAKWNASPRRDRQPIVDFREVPSIPVRCITVDAPDHLYCVGRRFTVTSNTQVLQEADERNRAAAPMVIRVHHELFNPLITRAWSLMLRLGQLPEPPPTVLARGGARVGYRNPILASQRQLSGLAAMRWFESLAPWGQVDPGVFDWADPDQVARLLHQAAGAPAHMLRDKRAVDGLRKARMAQEQAQADTANALAGVEATAKLVAAQKGAR